MGWAKFLPSENFQLYGISRSSLFFFPGLLNPLDCPHHMRQSEDSTYREGVVLDRPLKQNSKSGSYVDCGLRKVHPPPHTHIPLHPLPPTHITNHSKTTRMMYRLIRVILMARAKFNMIISLKRKC